MPVVEDDELMQRIRATNLGDRNNDLSSWTCRRCKKGRVSATPSVATSRELTVSSESHDDRTRLTSTVTDTTPTTGRVDQDQELVCSYSQVWCPPLSVPQRTARPLSDRKVPADEATIQSRVNQDAEDEDDPEDLYGPPVERRIIRILPSLAKELREQRRRAAAEKVITYHTLFTTGYIYSVQEVQEKRRAPLAPDWISARHVHDPLWKEIRPTVEGRKRRKPTARKLGDIGLNVDELVGCLVREHKTRMDV